MTTWKKVTVATLFAFAASYGTVSLGEPELAVYGVMSERQGPLKRAWAGTKAWVERHPALSGAIAGGVAGSWFPGLGTVAGIVTGAAVGSQIGSDERDEESRAKELDPAEEEDEAPRPPEAERKW